MSETLRLDVGDSSRVGEARRLSAQLAREESLSEEQEGTVSLIATELATNLFKHGKQGALYLRRLPAGIELIAVDCGPGIPNVGEALRDGFSTAGTRGMGLGAVRRKSDLFDITTTVGKGTVVLSRVYEKAPLPSAVEFGVICTRLTGETIAGDSFCVTERNGRTAVLVVDGLGHGHAAADASAEAIRVFQRHAAASAEDIVAELHSALRKTRGAAGSVAEVFTSSGRVHYCGVGNVMGVVLAGGRRSSMVSQNGTLGAEARRITAFDYPFPDDALLVMASDGITTHWDVNPYPGLLARHPSTIAAVIHRDFSRGRDDATVLVARRSQGQTP